MSLLYATFFLKVMLPSTKPFNYLFPENIVQYCFIISTILITIIVISLVFMNDCKAVGRFQTLEGQIPYRAVGGAVNPQSGVWSLAPELLQFSVFAAPQLKIRQSIS